MGDGVMDMEQVQSFKTSDIHHFAGKYHLIRRIIEQGIVGNIHLMMKDVFAERTEPDGPVVGDEVNDMSLLSQGFAQLGGHHTATSEGGIANDADFHGPKVVCVHRGPKHKRDPEVGWETGDLSDVSEILEHRNPFLDGRVSAE
jgi:hypothetical protein